MSIWLAGPPLYGSYATYGQQGPTHLDNNRLDPIFLVWHPCPICSICTLSIACRPDGYRHRVSKGISKAPGESRHLAGAVVTKVVRILLHILESHFASFGVILGSILRRFRHLGRPRDPIFCIMLCNFRHLGWPWHPFWTQVANWTSQNGQKAQNPSPGETILETFCVFWASIF